MNGPEPLRAPAEQQLFRLLLRASRQGAVVQDRLDCADFARDAGFQAEACMLYGLAALQIGLAPGSIAWVSDAHRSTYFLCTPAPESHSKRAADVLDVALADLARLMRSYPKLELPVALPSLAAGGTERPFVDGQARASIAHLADRTCSLLAQIGSRGDLDVFADELSGVAREAAVLEPIHLEEHLDLPFADKLALFVLEQVRQFTALNLELLSVRSGRGLFRQAASLPPGSLGPYFTNVWRIIRTPSDIPALIKTASPEHVDAQQFSTWCLLLSAHLRSHEVAGLAEELCNLGMVAPVRALLARARRIGRADEWREAVGRMRDAFIDVADFATAADAQRLLVSWRPKDASYWEMLAEIEASAGALERADDAFAHARGLDSMNWKLEQKQAAFKAGALKPLAFGYGSSVARAEFRRARYISAVEPTLGSEPV